MSRVAFDIHGTLDHDDDGLLIGILNRCLEMGDEVFIISGPPLIQIVEEVKSLDIDPSQVTIISVVDWLKDKGVKMWMDHKNTWWCEEDDWWSSKGKICEEYKIDMIFDDKVAYMEHMPETTKFVLWEGTQGPTYFGKGGKSDPNVVEL
jgi:hypothetical protein